VKRKYHLKLPTEFKRSGNLVAEIIVKRMKPHTVGKALIRPAYAAIVRTMFGTVAEEEIKKNSLSDDRGVDVLMVCQLILKKRSFGLN
jgi:hypothetical protein